MKRFAKLHPQQQRIKYLELLDSVGTHWVAVFNELVEAKAEMRQTHFWDLFTALWREDKPLQTMKALEFMRSVSSPQTRKKYLALAIGNGLVEQVEQTDAGPDAHLKKDSRVKYVRLTQRMRVEMDTFFDKAIQELLTRAREIVGENESRFKRMDRRRSDAKAA